MLRDNVFVDGNRIGALLSMPTESATAPAGRGTIRRRAEPLITNISY
jgi:hypothetical protein